MKTISIPIEIISKKKGQNKQNSFFYAGNDVARVKICNREYVLTTSGMYDFGLINGRKRGNCVDKFKIESHDIRRFRQIARNYRLTDTRIRKLTDDGHLIENWGWFGINVWEDEKCMGEPISAYSEYDEAMEAFINFVTKDIK